MFFNLCNVSFASKRMIYLVRKGLHRGLSFRHCSPPTVGTLASGQRKLYHILDMNSPSKGITSHVPNCRTRSLPHISQFDQGDNLGGGVQLRARSTPISEAIHASIPLYAKHQMNIEVFNFIWRSLYLELRKKDKISILQF